MNKHETNAATIALFAECWDAISNPPQGRTMAYAPFDFVSWMERAKDLGLLVEDDDGQYELADGVKRHLPKNQD